MQNLNLLAQLDFFCFHPHLLLALEQIQEKNQQPLTILIDTSNLGRSNCFFVGILLNKILKKVITKPIF